MFDDLKERFLKLDAGLQDEFVEEFSEFLHENGFPPQWSVEREALLARLHRYELAYGALISRADYERASEKDSGYVKLAYRLSELESYDDETCDEF